MSRLTILILAVGTIGLMLAAIYGFGVPILGTASETKKEHRHQYRKKFFKAPEAKPLVGQEMRPRW